MRRFGISPRRAMPKGHNSFISYIASLPTPAFNRRSMRWFQAISCKTTPEGLPPSPAQLHTSAEPDLHRLPLSVLAAHDLVCLRLLRQSSHSNPLIERQRCRHVPPSAPVLVRGGESTPRSWPVVARVAQCRNRKRRVQRQIDHALLGVVTRARVVLAPWRSDAEDVLAAHGPGVNHQRPTDPLTSTVSRRVRQSVEDRAVTDHAV